MTRRDELIAKLADEMDPDNATQFVDAVLKEAQANLAAWLSESVLALWREASRFEAEEMSNFERAHALDQCADEIDAALRVFPVPYNLKPFVDGEKNP